MPPRPALSTWVIALCLTTPLASAVAFDTAAVAGQRESAPEVRALWVTRNTLSTSAAIARMVAGAQRAGFNTLVVQVRGRGDAYYSSSLEPRAEELTDRPAFDPLAETLALAHRASIRVHAWVAVNLVSSAVDLPTSRQHIVYRQADWLMVPRALSAELSSIDPRAPDYLRRLARWTRARPAEVEGLYLSPIHPWAVTHVTRVVTELLTKYDLDGVHLDYVRFPNDDFDYSRAALQQFKVAIRPELAETDRRRADGQEAADLLAYPNLFPGRWLAFRQSRLTTLVGRIRSAVKATRPEVILSAAVVPDPTHAAESRLQDWRTWLDHMLLDVVCPMAYTQDVQRFEREIGQAQEVARGRSVWAGIGAYQLTATATLQQIEAARRQRVAGIILFSYDSLVTPPHGHTLLAELGRAAFRGSP